MGQSSMPKESELESAPVIDTQDSVTGQGEKEEE